MCRSVRPLFVLQNMCRLIYKQLRWPFIWEWIKTHKNLSNLVGWDSPVPSPDLRHQHCPNNGQRRHEALGRHNWKIVREIPSHFGRVFIDNVSGSFRVTLHRLELGLFGENHGKFQTFGSLTHYETKGKVKRVTDFVSNASWNLYLVGSGIRLCGSLSRETRRRCVTRPWRSLPSPPHPR